jgi:O-antigen chain-terminating methyltransferase
MAEDVVQLIKEDIEELLKAKRTGKAAEFSGPINFYPSEEQPLDDFSWAMEQAAAQSQVDISQVSVFSRRPLWGALATFYKRVVRKSTYWLLNPLFGQISLFNDAVLNALNKLILKVKNLDVRFEQDLEPLINRKLQERLNSFEHLVETQVDEKFKEEEKRFEQRVNRLQTEITCLFEQCTNKLETDQAILDITQGIQNVMQKIEILRHSLTDYRSESAFLRAKLAVTLQKIRTRKLTEPNVSEEDSLDETLGSSTWLYYIFEQQFRGTESMIKEKQRPYLPDIQKAFATCGGYVLEIGSGRGEFLELCREANIPAKGVDFNEAMINRCREKDLDVEKEDGLVYLQSIPDESLCALTAFQVVEHLTPDQILQLVQNAFIKLKPGGAMILETVNPDSLFAIKNFYLDLSHKRPVPSLTLQFILESVGLREVEVRLSSPVPEEMQLTGQDEATKMINDFLFGCQDYAVVGWR